MANIAWIQSGEKSVGRGHPTLADVDNRPLRGFMTALGLDPDADVPATALGGTSVLPTGATTPDSLADRFGYVPFLTDYGADPTGDEDSAPALNALIAAGKLSCLVYPGTYRFSTAVTDLPAGFTVLAMGGRSKVKFLRARTGGVFTIKTAGVEFHGVEFDADVGSSATYGTTSTPFIDFPATFTSADCRLVNCGSRNVDLLLKAAPDAATRLEVLGGYFSAYTLTAGSEGKVFYIAGPDVGSAQRKFVGVSVEGQPTLEGAAVTIVTGGSYRRWVMDDATFGFSCQGGIWGSLGVQIDIRGSATNIQGVRMAGDVVIDADASGYFIGNPQTSGTFTDNSDPNEMFVVHHPLSTDYHLLWKHLLMTGGTVGSLIKTCRRISPGNADSTFDPLGGVSHIRYSSAITADRTVTLTTTGAQGNIGGRVSRSAAATGAFNVIVGGLKNLAPGEWCDFEYNGSGYEITAFGAGVP